MAKHTTRYCRICLFLALILGVASIAYAEGFAATWKLLTPTQKEQFVAGYLQGYRDASTVTDVTLDYIKQNPQRAIEGLETLKKVYFVEGVRPAKLVEGLDQYFAAPENQGSSFSQAVNTVK